jgi:hypothetical protein
MLSNNACQAAPSRELKYDANVLLSSALVLALVALSCCGCFCLSKYRKAISGPTDAVTSQFNDSKVISHRKLAAFEHWSKSFQSVLSGFANFESLDSVMEEAYDAIGNVPESINAEQGREMQQVAQSLLVGNLEKFYPEVFISYATSNRPEADFPGFGPGTYYTLILLMLLHRADIPCISVAALANDEIH